MGWHIEPYFNTLIPPNGTGLIHNSWVIHTADTVNNNLLCTDLSYPLINTCLFQTADRCFFVKTKKFDSLLYPPLRFNTRSQGMCVVTE